MRREKDIYFFNFYCQKCILLSRSFKKIKFEKLKKEASVSIFSSLKKVSKNVLDN